MKKVSDFLADKLTHEDHAAVLKMLGEDDTDDDSDATMAGDAKRHYANVRDRYHKGLLNNQQYERAMLSPPPRPTTSADAARFAEMFPHAGRLKVL